MSALFVVLMGCLMLSVNLSDAKGTGRSSDLRTGRERRGIAEILRSKVVQADFVARLRSKGKGEASQEHFMYIKYEKT